MSSSAFAATETPALEPRLQGFTMTGQPNDQVLASIRHLRAIDRLYEVRLLIMAGFRSYFDLYPDQVSEDTLIEPAGERAIRSVWKLTATHRLTGETLTRSGEEIVTFDAAGMIVRVAVTDHPA